MPISSTLGRESAEVYSLRVRESPRIAIYHAHAHTSATQLGDIAAQARPKLLILNHQLFFGASDDRLLAEVRSRFSGHVVSARDLDIYALGGESGTKPGK